MVLDAFVIERVHLRVKAAADNIRNTRTFELSTLAGVLNNQISTWSTAMPNGLRGRTAPVPGPIAALVADRLEIGGLKVRCPICLGYTC